MKILAIETSCDETSASVIECPMEHSMKDSIVVHSNIVSSQVELHAKWGGVVPNLAAREHTKNIIPVLKEALESAKTTKDNIDLLAVTHGPGLIPALLSGVSAAKSLAYAWKKPLLGIHHIEGHIYANWINNPHIDFPVLALVVSGGHTQLILMKAHCNYEIVGQTQDDAVGEAFDKAARILGLGYPGGPAISVQADKIHNLQFTIYNSITLPRPMLNSGDLNFSFSGIKTAVLYTVKKFQEEHNLKDDKKLPEEFITKVSHEFQEACTEVLTTKTLQAAKKYNIKTILLAGGVSANKQLRSSLEQNIKNELPHTTFSAPKIEYCLDNAAMIATAAFYRWQIMSDTEKENLKNGWKTTTATANLPITIK